MDNDADIEVGFYKTITRRIKVSGATMTGQLLQDVQNTYDVDDTVAFENLISKPQDKSVYDVRRQSVRVRCCRSDAVILCRRSLFLAGLVGFTAHRRSTNQVGCMTPPASPRCTVDN